MKLLVVAAVCFVGLCLAEEQYLGKYDSINLVEVLQSDRLLNRYMDCLFERIKRCDNEAKYFKEKLPEAIQTDCRKCTDKQKIGAFKGIIYLMDNRPEIWAEIKNKFDPSGAFLRRNVNQVRYIRTHPNNFNEAEFLALFQ